MNATEFSKPLAVGQSLMVEKIKIVFFTHKGSKKALHVTIKENAKTITI
jgi:hypothetical protein